MLSTFRLAENLRPDIGVCRIDGDDRLAVCCDHSCDTRALAGGASERDRHRIHGRARHAPLELRAVLCRPPRDDGRHGVPPPRHRQRRAFRAPSC